MTEVRQPQVSEPRPEARLGLALRRARESRGISVRALARTLHRSHSTLVEFERGHRLASLDVVEAYETELGIEAGTLAAVHERARVDLYGEDRSHRRTYVLRPALDVPYQLPPDVASFTGRETELGKLRAPVAEQASGTVVISVIAGTAGDDRDNDSSRCLLRHRRPQLAELRLPAGEAGDVRWELVRDIERRSQHVSPAV